MLYAILALISAVIAAFSMYSYQNQGAANTNGTYLIVAIVFALLAVIFGGLFLSKRLANREEIHITE